MRTGRLSISRGGPEGEYRQAPRLAVVPKAEPAQLEAPAEPLSADYLLVHDRLTALERLARLRDQAALTAEEFAAEKAIVLGLPADELLLPEAAAVEALGIGRSQRGPSLVGRLFAWRILPVGLAAGVAFSYATQPQETLRFFDQALRLIGA